MHRNLWASSMIPHGQARTIVVNSAGREESPHNKITNQCDISAGNHPIQYDAFPRSVQQEAPATPKTRPKAPLPSAGLVPRHPAHVLCCPSRCHRLVGPGCATHSGRRLRGRRRAAGSLLPSSCVIVAKAVDVVRHGGLGRLSERGREGGGGTG